MRKMCFLFPLYCLKNHFYSFLLVHNPLARPSNLQFKNHHAEKQEKLIQNQCDLDLSKGSFSKSRTTIMLIFKLSTLLSNLFPQVTRQPIPPVFIFFTWRKFMFFHRWLCDWKTLVIVCVKAVLDTCCLKVLWSFDVVVMFDVLDLFLFYKTSVSSLLLLNERLIIGRSDLDFISRLQKT